MFIGSSNSNIITVTYPPGFVSGIITVASKNACGTSSTRSRFVSTNILPAPIGISGQVFTGLCGVNGASYSISNPITGANSYSWTVPSGATITSNTGSGITVNFATNFSGGLITVAAVNNCGPGTARSASVIGAPGFPTVITGPLSVCSGTNAVYSIPTVSGTSTYTWTWTRGFAYSSGQGTKILTLTAASVPAANQTITVKASNACGISNARVLDLIQIVSCPRIGSSEFETNLNVYPNPVNEIVNITFNSEKDQDCEMKMLDATERVVIKNSLKSKSGPNHYEINVRDLSAGIYLLQIQIGEIQKQLKVIIE